MMMKELNKEYWENRYIEGKTDWDAGKITTPLKEYIDQLENKNLKILIPGAGNGHEFEYLYTNGFTNIFVIDIAKQPLDNIRKRLPKISEKQLIFGDFFKLVDTFDLIIEQTFFCALEPALREKYVSKMSSLLTLKGKISGLLFQFPLTKDGPPYGGSKEEYQNLFKEKFKITTLKTAYNSIKPRQDKELFFIFDKK